MLALYRRALHARRAVFGSATAMTWLPAPGGVLAFDRGGVACVVNLSPTPVELPQGLGDEILLASGPVSGAAAAAGHGGLAADRQAARTSRSVAAKRVGLARLAVLAAEEAAVAAGEGDRRGAEPLGHGRAGPAGQLLGRTRRRRR